MIKNKRRESWINEIKDQEQIEYIDSPYPKCDIGREKKTITINKDGYSEAEFKEEKKDLIKNMKDDGYLLIEKINHIDKIFGKQTKKAIDKKRTGRRFYFVWKYSGYTDLMIKQQDKNDYLDSLGLNNERIVMQVIATHNLISNTYLIDETGFNQLSRPDGRLRQRDGKGKPIYIKDGESGKCYPKFRPATIDDCPLSLIQQIVKNEKLELLKKG